MSEKKYKVPESAYPIVHTRFTEVLGNGGQMIVSDPFLQMQYEYQTSKILPQIRVHGSYLRADIAWNMKREYDILVVDRPHECVLMCVLQYFIDRYDDAGGVDAGVAEKSSEKSGRAYCEKQCAVDLREKNYIGKKVASEGRLRIAFPNSPVYSISDDGIFKQAKEESSGACSRQSSRVDKSKARARPELLAEDKKPQKNRLHEVEDVDDIQLEDAILVASTSHTENDLADENEKRIKRRKRQALARQRREYLQTTALLKEEQTSCGGPVIPGESHHAAGQTRFSYPFQFVTRALTHTRSYEEFSEFRAVVLFPYDMDLITFYEFYAMNMPMFLPSHLSKYMFSQDHLDYDMRFSEDSRHLPPKLWPHDASTGMTPFQEDSVDAVFDILKFTDYFRYPAVQYFATIPELLHNLHKRYDYKELQKISLQMRRFNSKSLLQSVSRWERALKKVMGVEKFSRYKQAEY